MTKIFSIKDENIDDIFESFTLEEQSQYGVNESAFNASSKFMVNGEAIKVALGKIYPSSAGSFIGGENTTRAFNVNGQPIDIALKGRRPIGIPIYETKGPAEFYINRVSGETWCASSPRVAQGIRLPHDPQILFIELQAGGGGGAGSGLTGCSGGGGAGGYAFKAIELGEDDYIKIVVGKAGDAGNADANGGGGGDSYINNSSEDTVVLCYGGKGGFARSDSSADGGSSTGGDINISGGAGGGKEKNGGSIAAFDITLPKPESTVWKKETVTGGISSGNNYGGGGGASVFAKGADGDSRETPSTAGNLGSGGAGAGYQAFKQNPGTAGGQGYCKIYY